jgi:hypothetical protein
MVFRPKYESVELLETLLPRMACEIFLAIPCFPDTFLEYSQVNV